MILCEFCNYRIIPITQKKKKRNSVNVYYIHLQQILKISFSVNQYYCVYTISLLCYDKREILFFQSNTVKF